VSVARRELRIDIPEELSERIDARAAEQGVSRADFVRGMLDRHVAALSDEEIDRQIAEGYRRFPPDQDDPWLDTAAIEIIAEEPWNDVRFGGSKDPTKKRGRSSS
jgi:predicted DNA-binding protein